MDDDLEMQAYKLLIEPTSAPPVRGTRPASKMTPNTRFLSHIVREAKSHNAALLARETADAHKRLKRLMRKDGDNNSNEYRSSSEEDDQKDETRHRRRHKSRTEDAKHDEDRRRRRKRHADSDDYKREHDSGSRSHRSHRHHRSHHQDSSREDRARERERKDRDRRSRHSHRRDREDDMDEKDRKVRKDRFDREDRHSSRSKRRPRSESPSQQHSRRRSASPQSSKSKDHHRDRDRGRDRERTRHHSADSSRDRSLSESVSTSSSDPLDEFVGPRLASDRLVESSSDSAGVRIRGRGAHSAAAPGFSNSMDRHFAADYDPTKDVEHPLPAPRPEVAPRSTAEDEDTEMQDDRKQLLRDSSERLRKAGFTDREIAILARGGRRRPDYTPWAKRGEAREWDRDKVEGDEGPAKPAWAR